MKTPLRYIIFNKIFYIYNASKRADDWLDQLITVLEIQQCWKN